MCNAVKKKVIFRQQIQSENQDLQFKTEMHHDDDQIVMKESVTKEKSFKFLHKHFGFSEVNRSTVEFEEF